MTSRGATRLPRAATRSAERVAPRSHEPVQWVISDFARRSSWAREGPPSSALLSSETPAADSAHSCARARPPDRRRRASHPRHAGPGIAFERSPARPLAQLPARAGDRERRCERAQRATRIPGLLRGCVPEGSAELAGQLLRRSREKRDRAGHHLRHPGAAELALRRRDIRHAAGEAALLD